MSDDKRFRSLEIEQPKIAATWHPTKNLPIRLSQISVGSHLKAWWECDKGHSYQAIVSNRVGGRGCSYCGGKKVLVGFNDLASQCPNVAKDWDLARNQGVEPQSVMHHSNKRAWWVCDKGHSWEAVIASRVSGKGCPICANLVISSGVNDLATLRPEIANEWHPSKNGSLTPGTIGAGSTKKVWWRCQLGHEWEMKISTRSGRTTICPVCAGTKCWPGFNDLQTLYPDIALTWLKEKNLPAKIEETLAISAKKFWWKCDLGHEYQATCGKRVSGHGCQICGNSKVLAGFNDLASIKPFLISSWHPTKNLPITPEQVFAFGRTEYWWLCTEGHEFLASPTSRPTDGCPICSNKRLAPGTNDLASRYPEIAKSWHPHKNLPVTPNSIVSGKGKKYWWICDEGHEWEATVSKRIAGKGCGVCSNRTVISGINDLDTTNPAIAATWHPTLNEPIKVTEVSAGTHTSYWWLCDENHQWKATPNSRLRGTNCPSCAKGGFDPNKDGFLYLLRHDHWEMLQIGITNFPKKRLASHASLGWEVIDLRGPMNGHLTQTLETQMLRTLKSLGANLGPIDVAGKFDGYSESWTRESFEVSSIVSMIALVDENDS